MKAIVVYYSLDGNTKIIADAIAEEMDCEFLRLVPKKDVPNKGVMKYFWGGKQVTLKEKPELLPYDKNLNEYDLIIIGSPVWAGSFVSVFNTFFSEVFINNKKVALFCTYMGSEGKTFINFKNKLEGNDIIGQIGFKSPANKENTDENVLEAKKWISKLVDNM